MDLLKQELLKKKKAIEQAKKSSDVGRIGNSLSSDNNNSSSKTYLKAADVRRFQEKQQEREEEEIRRINRLKTNNVVYKDNNNGNNKKRKWTDDQNNSRRLDTNKSTLNNNKNELSMKSKENNDKISSDIQNESNQDQCNETIMSTSEITQALRELGIPVWLFGERNDTQRLDRLKEAKENRRATIAGLSEMDEYRLGSGHGIRNPFIGKGKDDDDFDLKQKQDKDDPNTKTQTSATNNEQEDEESDDPHKTIHRFFKNLLRQWENELVNRPDAVKRTLTGRNETKTLKQCKDYIRPLFKLCKNRTLEENIMGSILNIVNFCKEGEFVKANDAYMDLAIGRAAWPIGVTMVGIHQRTGRERINADKVAHVMNSELQRKYLTSVKRLMTYCQKLRPDVDPSKKVTNV